MYPDAEDEIKIGTLKNALSSLYEHIRTYKICHTYLNAILVARSRVKSSRYIGPVIVMNWNE
jgi:hypothetical protein